MAAAFRKAVRILCLDADSRVLLLHWRDPVGGALLWEPPGGGIDPGESPLDAARRELHEETGLDPANVADGFVLVPRDMAWKGKRRIGDEPFFVARFATARPALAPAGLNPGEVANLQGFAWCAPSDLAALADRVEPPQLPGLLAVIDPGGPWVA